MTYLYVAVIVLTALLGLLLAFKALLLAFPPTSELEAPDLLRKFRRTGLIVMVVMTIFALIALFYYHDVLFAGLAALVALAAAACVALSRYRLSQMGSEGLPHG